MISTETLREELDYNPETGIFTYRRRRGPALAGDPAGWRDRDKYFVISVLGRRYLAHRLAWQYVHGEWPPGHIDHANGNKVDNRISNLRLASRSQNAANIGLSKHNTSGIKGVSRKRKKWRAQITVDGKLHCLGTFACIEDATAAYETAARKFFGAYAALGQQDTGGADV